MFYAKHNVCSKSAVFRKNNDVIEQFSVSSWWHCCNNCGKDLLIEDLTMLYPGVEIVAYSGNHPEYQCLNGDLKATLRIDEEVYVFRVEYSGNRGSYPQWTQTWVTMPISVLPDGEIIPNTHKCGSQYWNEHCWFPVEPIRYFHNENNIHSLAQVIDVVRTNAAEIKRRASDSKYHAG